MTSTITETITNYTCVFKQQVKRLIIKSFLSIEERDNYVEKIISLLNSASDELLAQAEIAKGYPQPDAFKELETLSELIGMIAKFDHVLELRSDYLDREDLKAGCGKVIRAVFKLNRAMRRVAFSNRRCQHLQNTPAIPLEIIQKHLL